MDNLLTVHFHSMHGDYSRYSMWKWLDGYWGEEAHFSREDDFGLVGQVTSPSNRFIDSVNLLVKTEDWSRQTHDYRVRRPDKDDNSKKDKQDFFHRFPTLSN